jgi:acyl-CoA dehydrogenase
VREHQPDTLEVVPVRTMFNYATNEVHYRGMRIPASSLIGAEGQGFRYVIDGWKAERILLAAEAIGDGYWFTDRRLLRPQPAGVRPADRRQPGRAVPDHLRLHAGPRRRPDALRGSGPVRRGPALRRRGQYGQASQFRGQLGRANACLDTHGGDGFVDAYDVERKFRETRLYQVAPVNNNLVTSFVANKVLGLPRSY